MGGITHKRPLSLYCLWGRRRGGERGGRNSFEAARKKLRRTSVGLFFALRVPRIFFSFSNSNGFPCRTGFDCFLLEWRQKNEFELRSLKYSQIWRPDAESDNKNWKSWQSFCLTGNRNKTITGRRAHSKRPSRTVKRTVKNITREISNALNFFNFPINFFLFLFFC